MTAYGDLDKLTLRLIVRLALKLRDGGIQLFAKKPHALCHHLALLTATSGSWVCKLREGRVAYGVVTLRIRFGFLQR